MPMFLSPLVLAILFQTATPAKPSVFLGPPVSPTGFTSAPLSRDLQDSYKDMRKAYAETPELRAAFTLAESAETADVVLTISTRDEEAVGQASATTTVVGRTAVTSANQRTVYRLLADVTVPGTEVKIALDGRTGMTLITWSRQAKNLLKQTAEWMQANAEALAKARAARQ